MRTRGRTCFVVQLENCYRFAIDYLDLANAFQRCGQPAMQPSRDLAQSTGVLVGSPPKGFQITSPFFANSQDVSFIDENELTAQASMVVECGWELNIGRIDSWRG